MKVTLIRPPSVHNREAFSAGVAIPPIGVALISAYLKKKEINCNIIDALGEGISTFHKIHNKNTIINGLSIDDILKRISDNTTIVGISCMFSSEWFFQDFLIHQIKKTFPQIKIIVGGEHITADWKNVLELNPQVDYCVIGEGEESFHELILAIENNSDMETVDGIAFRSATGPKRTKARKRIKKLDELPWPDWTDFPIDKYHDVGYSQASINRKAMPVLASRGCPFSCTFCTSPQMWGNELQLRSPDDIIKEIKHLYQVYKIEHIDFIDIVGVLNPRWTKELLEKLCAADLPVTWLHGAGTRSEVLSPEILDLFKKSKALRIFYAPESGSKKTIKLIKKRVDLKKMISAMIYTNKLGLSMRAPLIFGFPGQSLFEVMESLIFGIKMVFIGVDDIVVHPFSSHPGSELYHYLINEGKIDVTELIRNNQYYDFLRGQVHTKFLNQTSWSEKIPHFLMPVLQLGSMSLFYSLQFVLRPHRLWYSIKRSLFKRKPLTLFDHVVYRLIIGSRFKISFNNLKESNYIERHLIESN